MLEVPYAPRQHLLPRDSSEHGRSVSRLLFDHFRLESAGEGRRQPGFRTALYALLDRGDANHAAARSAWASLLERDEPVVTTSYVLVETYALVQRRLGLDALRTFAAAFVPLLDIVWVDAALHEAGIAGVLAARRRDLSLVDCVSFEAMRQRHIDVAFAFDPHFHTQGFRLWATPRA